jgi:hypothetical protein
MLEQPVAQLLQHPVADHLGQIRLGDVQDAVDDWDRDQRRHQRIQHPEIGTTPDEQGVVEHPTDQQRADHTQQRRRQDHRDDQREHTPVGPKQTHDPPAELRRIGLRKRCDHRPRLACTGDAG